ncbi:hypothetical protein PIB30_096681 [Stylosanthes scabra]|uniref:Uncharacterized protein n=1 Tax=Stylosanthes scabra TaxID=79078 RepID=A0ABU6UWB1_9FABA|nr:hypothetical protein [Stylosanthes scabra]
MEQQQQGFTLLNKQLASMQIQQQTFFENMQSTQAQYLEELKAVKTRQDELCNNNKFHHQIRKEQDMLAREIQEMKKYQVNQILMFKQKGSMKKLEQTMANPKLTKLPIHQISELEHLNAEKGRHIFHEGLKSHLVAGSSSQAALPQAPPSNPTDRLWLTLRIRHKQKSKTPRRGTPRLSVNGNIQNQTIFKVYAWP